MEMIISRRHRINFYLFTTAISLVWIGMATVCLCLGIHQLNMRASVSKVFLPLIFSVGLFLIAVYTWVQYFRNVPIINIDEEKISFNTKTYYWTEFDKIIFSGKKRFKYMSSNSYEATTITFQNGDKQVIFDSMYENITAIKTFLQNKFILKKDIPAAIILDVEQSELFGEEFETFKGNPVFSLSGILMWGMIGFLVYSPMFGSYKRTKEEVIRASISLGIFWFNFSAWQMNYVQLSQRLLLIRNHYLFWKKKVYRVADISEVVFESFGKMPNSLRVITKDFKSEYFIAATLTNTTWLALKDALESRGITVRNECIPT